jgi:nitroimidazol reductase NimA-like FMN-containing flavoprotein (pyridoxamine 5'-phosphate oxidase superfamily)
MIRILSGYQVLTIEDTKMSAITPLFPLPASPQNLPLFRALGPAQIEALLFRNSCGRIAFALGGRVQMLPANYVYVNGWIYGRTADAACLPKNAPVGFEVEERDNLSGWRSVLVQGQLDMVESESPEKPTVFFRDQLFCIRAAHVSGRGSLPEKTMSCAS